MRNGRGEAHAIGARLARAAVAVLLIAGPALGSGAQAPPRAPDEGARPKTAVQILNFPVPDYPQDCESQGVEGTVVVKVLFGADGTVKDAKIVRGLPCGLDDMAIKAVHQFKFNPAKTPDGRAVDQWKTVHVEFTRSDGNATSQPPRPGTPLPPAEWQAYRGPAGTYEVLLPGAPRPAPEARRADLERMGATFVGAGGHPLVAMVMEIPVGAQFPSDPGGRDAFLERALASGFASAGMEADGPSRVVEHAGRFGREAVGRPSARIGGKHLVARAFGAGDRVVLLMATIGDDAESRAAARRFFESLKFL